MSYCSRCAELEKQLSVEEKAHEQTIQQLADDVALGNRMVAKITQELYQHRQAVGKFLSEMYCTMIDPLADGTSKVEDTCKALLQAAVEQRQREHDQLETIQQLQADKERLDWWLEHHCRSEE